MDKPSLIFAAFISIIALGVLSAKDDDSAFSKSLAEKGYVWLAEKEGKQVLKKTWEQKAAALIQSANEIEGELRKEHPDMERIKKIQKQSRETGKEIIQNRREAYEQFKKKNEGNLNPKTKDIINEAQSRLALVESLFYCSFAYKETDKAEWRKFLTEALEKHLNDLNFMYGETVIYIPYFTGQCLWELERYKKAAQMLRTCNRDIFIRDEFALVRKIAYERIVQSYFKTKEYTECVKQAVEYLIEFPGKEDKLSQIGQTVRLYMAKALVEMKEEQFDKVKGKINAKENKLGFAKRILMEIDIENGPCAGEARMVIADNFGGSISSIIKGIELHGVKDYQKAVSYITKGLKQAAQEDIPVEKRFVNEAKGWYFLGFSYYEMDMIQPAVIAFKEGAVKFMKIYRERHNALNKGQKRWFLGNIKNWKNSAGKYYEYTHSKFGLDLYREALLVYREIMKIEGKLEGKEDNINILLAKIMAERKEYRDACLELDAIVSDSPAYPEALRLKGKYTWKLYRKEGGHDKTLVSKALELLEESRSLFLKKDQEDMQPQIFDIDIMTVIIHYKTKEYMKVIQGIDDFWVNPPKDKDIKFTIAQYQISACMLVKADEKDKESVQHKLRCLARGHALLERINKEFPLKKFRKDIRSLQRSLGFAYFNMSRKCGILGKEEKERCLDSAGELLHSFAMNACEPDEEHHIIAVSNIIFEDVKNHKLAEDVTGRAVQIFTKRVKGKFPPYDEKTRKRLEEFRNRFFDRHEARDRWDLMIDRMHDGKDGNGKQLARKNFLAIEKECWPAVLGEEPYLYEEAYKWLSEALVFELGYTEKKRVELFLKRDSCIEEEVDAFWKDLFGEFRDTLVKDPGPCAEIRSFLENVIKKHQYQERLGDCYFNNRTYEKALAVYMKLDEYYMGDFVIKRKVGETYLRMAQNAHEPDKQKKLAEKARYEFMWVKKYSPVHTKEGQIEYYEAVFKIAECWAVTDKLSAKKSLVEVKLHSPVQYPSEAYKQKLHRLIKEYEHSK